MSKDVFQQSRMTARPSGAVFSHLLLAIFTLLIGISIHSGPVQAFCYTPCVVISEEEPNQTSTDNMNDHDSDEHDDTRDIVNDHTDEQFEKHKQWMLDTVWTEWLIPNMQRLTEQISAVALWQMEAIGTLLDAKHQLETQRLFQQMSTIAYKDYTPSDGLCTVASMTRSLAGTERNVEMTSLILSQRAMERQLLKINTSATEAGVTDRSSRFAQFQLRYCDSSDNNNGLQTVCQHDAAIPNTVLNKDIDYYRTVGQHINLDINLNNPDITSDETDVFALQSNLYAHDVPQTYQAADMRGNSADADSALQKYLDMRAIAAKRSVAENSYSEIAALKATGQTSVALTAQYLRAALLEMGISNEDAIRIIGENPSYYAQMEVLTRRMFQRPEFFVDLYDKPANIERKSVALQAVSVMQRRDIFKSALRTESMMSLLLELSLVREQDAILNAE